MMDRRTFVRNLGLAATATSIAPWPALAMRTPRQGMSLKQAAAARGILYGAAARMDVLSDADYGAAFARECAIMTPESETKMGVIFQGPNRYNFGPGDALLQFGQSHGIAMRGHTLAFWQSIPRWLPSYVNKDNARAVLTQYIQTVCGHYAGKLHSWDVLNEAIDPPDGNPGGLKNSIWLSLIGPDYIALAFNTARQADPHAMLVYNERGVEYAGGPPEAQRTATLTLLETMKSQNVPVQALGIQGHLYGDNTPNFKPRIFENFLTHVSDMGLKILITEMDVQDKKLPRDHGARDQSVAQAYSTFIEAALQNPNVIVVETWGLSDRYTWLREHAPRADGDDVRVLPLDTDLNSKVVYQSLRQAFTNAPPHAT